MRLVVPLVAALTLLPILLPGIHAADAPTVPMPGSLSPLVPLVHDQGVAPASQRVRIAVGLDLHDKAGLDAFLADVSNPLSAHYQQFLTQDQFNARYGPSAAQEQRVVGWLQSSGFTVTDRFSNRLLVVAEGDNAAVQAAFGVPLHVVTFQDQTHVAVLQAPQFPADIAAFSTGVTGLDDLTQMRPLAAVGSSCCSFSPGDLATFYDNGHAYTGSGQTVVIAGAYAWKDSDNTQYNSQWSLPAMPTGTAQVCAGSGSGCGFDSSNSIEVALDVEMIHAVAPNAVIKNYMSQTTALTDFQTMYNKIVTDNPGHVVSSSWGSCESNGSSSYQTTDDNIFANGNAIGQSWFAASGDNGSNDCGSLLGGTSVDHPANAPHVMGVGGTHAVCSSGMTSGSPNCGGYGSEAAWSGSGGGASAVFSKPSFQTGCSVPADGKRDVPDVSMESDTSPGNWVRFNGGWSIVGGTSDAAPQWAGYFALLNQKLGGSGVGLPGARLYQLCGGNSFHDVTSGSNGGFSAHSGYDQVTGIGTIDANNLLNNWGAGAPATAPGAPTGLTATGGNAQVGLSWSAPASDGGATITSYKVYRGTTSGGETLLTTLGNVHSYTDTGVTNGQTYYYKVSAVNSAGEGSQSNEASATPAAPVQALNESFDASTAAPANWTLTGLWRVGPQCQGAYSAPNSLQYNQASTCTYDTGAQTAGDATSPALDLTGFTLPNLTFRTRWNVDHLPVSGMDKMLVQVKAAGATSWTTLMLRDSATGDQNTWTQITLPLNPYKSAGTQIRFEFDSVTALNNGYAGWAIDDVTVG